MTPNVLDHGVPRIAAVCRRKRRLFVAAAASAFCAAAGAQLDGSMLSTEHSVIGYRSRPLENDVAKLQQRIELGAAKLELDPRPGLGFLPDLLRELGVPVESQLLVYSKTSLQAPLIAPQRPRAIYFNDDVAVGAVHGGIIEIAVQDAAQGAVFYTLEQSGGEPRLERQGSCLGCHYSLATLGVPGFLLRSIPTAADGQLLPWLGNADVSHATPLAERWGGWYVTGDAGSQPHFGNALIADRRAAALPTLDPTLPQDLRGRFRVDYLTPYSDVVAHLVFAHQVEMMNVLTRVGWEFRIAAAEERAAASLARTVADAVDYMLFVDEARIGKISGSSGFAERFAALGPRDRRGRSLRELALDGRLMRYPLSYTIYSKAFDGLPSQARDALYRRLADVLSGAVPDARYERLSPADRRAILEILADTKRDLPEYFLPPN